MDTLEQIKLIKINRTMEQIKKQMSYYMDGKFEGIASNYYTKKGIIQMGIIKDIINDFDGFCENEDIEPSNELETAYDEVVDEWIFECRQIFHDSNQEFKD